MEVFKRLKEPFTPVLSLSKLRATAITPKSQEYGLHREEAGGQGVTLQNVDEHVRQKKRERKYGDKKPENHPSQSTKQPPEHFEQNDDEVDTRFICSLLHRAPEYSFLFIIDLRFSNCFIISAMVFTHAQTNIVFTSSLFHK